MLKILAGQSKGRVLKTGPKSPHLRPILARVKKSLFDIIRPRLNDCRFLDLYAGTGAVGIEALSRGAHFCAFVEQDRRSSHLLKQNLAMLKYEDQSQIFHANAAKNLSFLPGPFDLVFMGPPYKDEKKIALELVAPTLKSVVTSKLVTSTSLIVAQHHKKEKIILDDLDLEFIRQERYGDTLLTFFKYDGR